MTQTYTIDVTMRPVDADDTAGYAVDAFKQKPAEFIRPAPVAAIRLTPPAPGQAQAIDFCRTDDVQGFSLSVEAPEEDVQGHIWMYAILLGAAGGLGWSMAETLQQEFGTTAPKNPKSNDNP